MESSDRDMGRRPAQSQRGAQHGGQVAGRPVDGPVERSSDGHIHLSHRGQQQQGMALNSIFSLIVSRCSRLTPCSRLCCGALYLPRDVNCGRAVGRLHDPASHLQMVGIAEGVFGIFCVASGLPAGWLADRMRRDRLLRIFGCLMLGARPHPWQGPPIAAGHGTSLQLAGVLIPST